MIGTTILCALTVLRPGGWRRDCGQHHVRTMLRNRPFFVALLSLCLAACKTAGQDNPHRDTAHTEMVVRYAGTLPCGDCKGIRTVLTLYSDPNPTRYELRETYLGTRNGNQTFISWGRWMIAHGIANDKDAVVYQLTSDRPNQTRSYLKDGDHELIPLDRMRGVVSPRNPPFLFAVPAEAVNSVVITERSPTSTQIPE